MAVLLHFSLPCDIPAPRVCGALQIGGGCGNSCLDVGGGARRCSRGASQDTATGLAALVIILDNSRCIGLAAVADDIGLWKE